LARSGERSERDQKRQERRPAFGRFPWLALLRRARSLRFFVFFDMKGSRLAHA
jgi:hypothetical protein